MTAYREFWKNQLGDFARRFSPALFGSFIAPLQCEGGGGKLSITAPHKTARDWARKELAPLLRAGAKRELHSDLQVEFIIAAPAVSSFTAADAKSPDAPPPGKKAPTAKSAEVDDSGLRADLNLDNFVPGKANELALVAARQVAQSKRGAARHNPLFICGGSGLGKTHLSHAVGNRFRADNPGVKICHINANNFMNEVVRAYLNGAADGFKRRFRALDMLIIDDIQYIGGNRERTQDEFFFLFNDLVDGKKSIVITCDKLPRQIKDMKPRLVSRFGWGLTAIIEPPELELRIAILLHKAQERAIALPLAGARHIAERVKSNIRELEGALNTVFALAEFRHMPITPELAREALDNVLGPGGGAGAVTVEEIQKKAAEYYRVRLSDFKSARRSRSVARPRQVAIYLTRLKTTMSLPEIGASFGGRNHTTVLHACRRVEELLKTDAQLAEDIKLLSGSLS
jgi:chromosomal replication initiator protein